MAKQTDDFKYRGRSAQITSLTTSMQDIATAGADGSDITAVIISLNGATPRSVTVEIYNGSTSHQVGVFSVAANSGFGTTNAPIDLVKGGDITGQYSQLPGTELLGTLQILPLPATWKLRAKQDTGTDCIITTKQKDY